VRIEVSDGSFIAPLVSPETNIIQSIHPMKNLFTLFAVAAAFTLTSCQATKKDCSSCTSCDKKPAAACCKDGSCAKCKAKK